MNSSLEKSGYWWHPRKPKRKIYGILTFRPSEGSKLHFIPKDGQLMPADVFLTKNRILHGETLDKELISLIGCRCFVDELSGSINNNDVFVELIVTNAFVPLRKKFKIHNITINFEYLAKWIEITGIKGNQNHFGYYYEEPTIEPNEIAISKNVAISFNFGFTSKSSFEANRRISLQEQIDLTIKTQEPQPFQVYRNLIRIIQDFFSIACLELIMPTNITVYSETNNAGTTPPLRLLYSMPYYAERSYKSHSIEFLFRYRDISDIIPQMLSNWVKKADKLKIVRDLYNSAVHFPQEFLVSKFLLFVQALGVYHRDLYEDGYVEKKIYKQYITKPISKALTKDAPEEFKKNHKEEDWKKFIDILKSRIGFLREYTLATRLISLSLRHKESTSLYIPETEETMQGIANYRNLFTHYGKKYKAHNINTKNLVWYTEITKFMLELCFLYEMGLSEDRISKLVKNCITYQNRLQKNGYYRAFLSS